MEELYSETYLKAKPPMQRRLIRYLLIALMVVVLLIGLCAMAVTSLSLLFLVAMLVAIVIYFLLPTTRIAYEYIFVDGQIDFDRILKGEKRKTMMRADMQKIEIVAQEQSYRLNQYNHLPLRDFSSGYATDKHYIAVVLGDKGTERVRFTPDEKLLQMMQYKAPSKVIIEVE